jgi:hypothetical protein
MFTSGIGTVWARTGGILYLISCKLVSGASPVPIRCGIPDLFMVLKLPYFSTERGRQVPFKKILTFKKVDSNLEELNPSLRTNNSDLPES